MYFGAEFFDYNLFPARYSREFFGEVELEIPTNLFDFEIPFVSASRFGIRSFSDPEYNYFFDRIFNFNFHAYLFPDLSRNFSREINDHFGAENNFYRNYKNVFLNTRKFLETIEKLCGFCGFLSCNNFKDIKLQSAFARGFTKIFNYAEHSVLSEFKGVDITRNLFRKYDENYLFSRSLLREINEFIEFTQFDPRKFFDIAGIDSEMIYGSFKFPQGLFFEFERYLQLIDPDQRVKRSKINSENIIVPGNIFLISANAENSVSTEEDPQREEIFESLSSRLNRRIERLEEIARSEKTTREIDCGSVIRQLDLELRSALNSCCEGVHF